MSFLDGLETPHAYVDLERVRRNLERVHRYAKSHGISLRPHTKTHKDDRIGRMQMAAGADGLTVATAKEAEVMANATTNLLVAYPAVDRARIERLLALPAAVELTIALDSAESIERIRAAAAASRRVVRILVELDLGGRRTGIATPDELVRLARLALSPWTEFAGVLYHPGQLRAHVIDPSLRNAFSPEISEQKDAEEFARFSEHQRALRADLSRHLESLERHDIPCPIVSGGNTPSLFFNHLVPELTEIRPGTYVYSDRDIASQGILPWDACAYGVVATVVSTAVSGQAVVDAGTKSLAKEPIAGLVGLGALVDHPEIHLKSLSEEHGILDTSGSSYAPRVGDRVRIVPNHVCVSVHLQDRIAFLDGDHGEVRDVPARGRA